MAGGEQGEVGESEGGVAGGRGGCGREGSQKRGKGGGVGWYWCVGSKGWMGCSFNLGVD